jgi:trimethylamine--corrinoid protein Co-methyltransferase
MCHLRRYFKMHIGKLHNEPEIMFSTLNQDQVREIHSKSIKILEELGMVVHYEGALQLLKEAGAFVEADKVFIPAAMVENAIRTAPSRFTLYDRNGNAAMHVEHRNVYYGTGSDTPNRIDYESGERCKWTKKDVEDGITLCDYLENIDFVMSMGLISDVETHMNTREQYAVMLRKSKKPQIVVCDDVNDLKDVIAMAAAVRGSLEKLQHKPLFAVYCEPTSPLVNTFDAIDKLLLCAEQRIPVNYAAGGLSGGTTPVTAAGTILLNNAECLLGLVIHQLKNPGAPFLYGFGNGPMDLKTMQSIYASPTAIQIQGGMCELARFYQLPSWGEAGDGVSKLCDEQSTMEASHFILMAALQGCNVTHDVGYLDCGLSISFEHLAICDEIISRTKATVKELKTDEEYLGYDAIARVGHGGNYILDKHTYDHMREEWRGDLSDFNSYETWHNKGKLSMSERAHQKVKHILSNYQPEPLPAEVDAKIEEILEQAR